MKKRWVGLAIGGLVAASMGLGITPALAAEGYVTDATMISQPGESFAAGTNHVWRDGAGSVEVSRSGDEGLRIQMAGGSSGGDFEMTFAAPRGQSLADGVFENAQRTSDRTGDHPGMDITGEGRSCDTVSGWFRVRDLFADLQQLQISYELHCNGSNAPLTGNIRIHVYEQNFELYSISRSLSWPNTRVGGDATAFPVTIVNHEFSTVTIGEPRVENPSTRTPDGDFEVHKGDCGVLSKGESCQLSVIFNPKAGGWRDGSLEIPTSRRGLQVNLTGFAEDGYTSWALHSDAGDPIGGGPRTLNFTPEDSIIRLAGSPRFLEVSVDSRSEDFSGEFRTPDSRPMRAGETYDTRTRTFPEDPTEASMTITGNSVMCSDFGRFTIQEAAYDGDRLKRLRLTFENHCGDRVPGMTGSIAWQAGSTAEPVSESVLRPPPRPLPDGVTGLKADTAGSASRLSWTNPNYSGYHDTVVRTLPGDRAPANPDHGSDVWTGGLREASVGEVADGKDHSFSVFARDRAGEPSAPVSITLRGTRMTQSVSSTHAIAGDTVEVSGRLTDSAGVGVAGMPINVFHDFYRGDEFTLLKTVTTGVDGTYSFLDRPTTNRLYYAHFPGSGEFLNSPAGPEDAVSVAPLAHLKADRYAAPRGSTFTLRADVSIVRNLKVNPSVVLQRLSKGVWRTAKTGRLTTNGRATFRVRPRTKGQYQFRVIKRADKARHAGTSRAVKLVVR